MELTEERLARIWLQAAPMGAWNKILSLKEKYGGPLGVWNHFSPGLYDVLGESAYAMLADLKRTKCREIIRALEQLSANVLFFGDSHYPFSLSAIDHAPDVLFIRGKLPAPHAPSIAIVGSRRSTRYGAAQARRIARELAEKGVIIVSGLARGIDSAAHLGALDVGGKTIAVLGCGLSVNYPPENKELAAKIIESGGAIVSELAPAAPPLAHHFPVRNRIISGLSDGVLLIEAQEKSGTHSTINYALNQGREVFALPGNVDAPGSELPLKLLKEGASICSCGEDIFLAMGWEKQKETLFDFFPDAKHDAPQSQDEKDPILIALEKEEKTLEELLQETGIPIQDLNFQLTMLEMNGRIERRPGRAYALSRP